MRSLALPARPTAFDLDLIISKSRGETRVELLAARQDILDLFDGYRDDRGWDLDTPLQFGHLSAKVQSALLRSYRLTYKGKALADLRAELLRVDDRLCPYCRLLLPDTLDHFLPKSTNQPFASFAPNLVPMCGTCNTLKGTKGAKRGRQFFTHAYFDELTHGEPYMIAQVAVGARHIATNFTIDFSASLDAEVFQRLAYQTSVLRLVQRYQLEAIDVIHEQAVKLDGMATDGCSAGERRLSIEGDAETEARFGRSYWKTALLEALAANADFCDDGYRRAL
jgi:hypothetical protein